MFEKGSESSLADATSNGYYQWFLLQCFQRPRMITGSLLLVFLLVFQSPCCQFCIPEQVYSSHAVDSCMIGIQQCKLHMAVAAEGSTYQITTLHQVLRRWHTTTRSYFWLLFTIFFQGNLGVVSDFPVKTPGHWPFLK